MSDFVAGPARAAGERGIDAYDGGSPPPVLMAALGAAALIAVVLVAVFSTGGGGADSDSGSSGALVGAAAGADMEGRVRLTVSFQGDGSGRIEIGPRGDTCTERCQHSFATGTRVTVRATPASGSTFAGWSGSCDGDGRCSFVMDKPRTLTVALERKPAPAPASSEPLCPGDDATTCEDDGADALDTRPIGRSDCLDGKDNDGDGLTDAAQDPGCDADDTEAEGSAPAMTPPPAATNDCADGRDNDRDGLTDSAQDPDCTTGAAESGAATGGAATRRPPAAIDDCADRKDNDGDGLVDKAQDPGCDEDRTEAGAP
jgi:hypothetical protein